MDAVEREKRWAAICREFYESGMTRKALSACGSDDRFPRMLYDGTPLGTGFSSDLDGLITGTSFPVWCRKKANRGDVVC